MRNNYSPVVGLIQARLSSSRLPGKVLKTVLRKPLLLWQIERLRASAALDLLVVATSESPQDDPIAELCHENDVCCYRGSLDDVLARMYCAAKAHGAGTVVRLTGDCTLLDPRIVDRMVEEHFSHGADVTSNSKKPVYPDGMDVEVCSFESLERAHLKASRPSEREHVTLYFYNHPHRFSIHHMSLREHEQFPLLRLTVDEPRDFEKIRCILEVLAPGNPLFSLEDILAYLEQHPEVEALNAGIGRNEGLERSLQKEREQEQEQKLEK